MPGRLWPLLVLLGIVVSAAWAGNSGYTFTVLPSSPVAGQPLQIRVQTIAGMCTPLPTALLVDTPEAGVVRYGVASSDACFPPNIPAEDRTYDVPSLASAQYVFRFAVCGAVPTPSLPDGCATLEEQSVVVFGISAAGFTIPALSWGGIVVLTLGLLLVFRLRK